MSDITQLQILLSRHFRPDELQALYLAASANADSEADQETLSAIAAAYRGITGRWPNWPID